MAGKFSIHDAMIGWPHGWALFKRLLLFVSLNADPDQVKELVSKCLQARDAAYCPYSQFPVGAAVLTADGAIITGKKKKLNR